MKKETKRRIRVIGVIVFVLYMLALLYFLFFAEDYGRAAGTGQLRYNVVPFREISRFWQYRELLGRRAVFLNLAGNILGFVPFGLILPIMHPRLRKVPWTIVLCLLFSVSVEVLQLFSCVGSCDVDDVILNTIGGTIGYLLFQVVNRVRKNWYG